IPQVIEPTTAPVVAQVEPVIPSTPIVPPTHTITVVAPPMVTPPVETPVIAQVEPVIPTTQILEHTQPITVVAPPVITPPVVTTPVETPVVAQVEPIVTTPTTVEETTQPVTTVTTSTESPLSPVTQTEVVTLEANDYSQLFKENINDILGVVYDENKKQLLFFGKKEKNFPDIEIEDLVVLLDFVQKNIPLQLSLAKNKKNSMDFSGNDEFFSSSIGNTFAEALILITSLELGKNLITGTDIKVALPGFESLYEKCKFARYRGTLVHKTFLTIQELTHVQNPSNSTLVFDNIDIDIQATAILNNCMTDTQCTPNFNSFFHSHFKELSSEFPAFQKLKNLSKLLTIAKWLQEKSIALESLRSDQKGETKDPFYNLALNSERKDVWTKERAPLPKEEKEWNKKHNIKSKVLETYTFLLQSSGSIFYELSPKNHLIYFDSSLNNLEHSLLQTHLEKDITGKCELREKGSVSIVALPIEQ
ncbi:MAG: hypothetical protein WCP39_06425, partial [Chlamydiota bacterium]